MTKRNLTARYFKSVKSSRIYEDGKWIYSTYKDLSDFTSEDIYHFLGYGNYWRK